MGSKLGNDRPLKAPKTVYAPKRLAAEASPRGPHWGSLQSFLRPPSRLSIGAPRLRALRGGGGKGQQRTTIKLTPPLFKMTDSSFYYYHLGFYFRCVKRVLNKGLAIHQYWWKLVEWSSNGSHISKFKMAPSWFCRYISHQNCVLHRCLNTPTDLVED